MSYKKKVGENIRYERIKRNISIDELAEKLGLSTAFIGLIERGQRGAKLSNLMKIAEIFGITVNDLIYANHGESSSVNEPTTEDETADEIATKKNTIFSLLYNLGENELDFVIASIRNLRIFRSIEDPQNDVEDDDDAIEY